MIPVRQRSFASVARGLVLSCHPLPCLAVTAFATAYAAAIHASGGRLVSIAAALLAGQLCVGWSNDAIDAPLDQAAARADKPISAGLLDRRTVLVAAWLAAVVCVLLSFRLGILAGVLHLIAVISAIGYNGVLKSTLFSPLPYVISFGLLPMMVTFAVHGPSGLHALSTAAGLHGLHAWHALHGPPWSQVLAAALLGAAAHAGNTVGDTEADSATGVRGLPQRLGPQRSLIAMAVLIALAAIVLLATLFQNDHVSAARRVLTGVLLGTAVLLACLGALRRVGVPGGRAAWRLTLLAVTLVIAGFLTSL